MNPIVKQIVHKILEIQELLKEESMNPFAKQLARRDVCHLAFELAAELAEETK
jgi:hypothetical protein